MSLLRGGTVFRRLPSLSGPDTIGEDDSLDPDAVTSDRKIAPIEDVAQVVEGLSTTITFTFKAVEGEELQPCTSPGYTILCAEDNRVCQRLLSKLLGKFGQDHVMTENGHQALEVYKSNPGRFPVILMDLAMPIMDGFEATRLIRAFESTQPARRHTLIVGLTAHNGLYPMPFNVFAAGFDMFLSKPFQLRFIYEMFLGGPETNIVFLYTCLTEEEKSAYPREVAPGADLGDDPRSNAIREELKRRAESNWDGQGIHTAFFTKIMVKVIKASEDEDITRTKNEG
ncbi:CheY-like protein [Xylariaceae sp. AK1471]|nr:CheY-like protein [Xylariaceae sp. AK1471]